MRGSRCVPPSISGTPKRRSVKPSFASSVAIRRSHHSASSSPPARHQPEIAAIVGFDGGPAGEAERALGQVQPRAERLDRLQVGAGAEGHAAGAGEDQHARVVVGLEALEGLAERLGGRPVDRVAALLAVDRDDRGRARALVARPSSP